MWPPPPAFWTQPRAAVSPPGKEMPGSSSSLGGGAAAWLTCPPGSPTHLCPNGAGPCLCYYAPGHKERCSRALAEHVGRERGREPQREPPRLASGRPMTTTFASGPSCPLSHRALNPGGGTGEMTASVGYLGGQWWGSGLSLSMWPEPRLLLSGPRQPPQTLTMT